MSGATIVWFRQDLRIADNPALRAAVDLGDPVVPVYIWDPSSEGNWALGGAARWWVQASLASLELSLRRLGSRLIVRHGAAGAVLGQLAAEVGARRVVWNRRVEPAAVETEARVRTLLVAGGIVAQDYDEATLWPPDLLLNAQGKPRVVFTPFWNAASALPPPAQPSPPPRALRPPTNWPAGLQVDSLELAPERRAAGRLSSQWEPGEAGAHRRLLAFLMSPAASYSAGRDRPGDCGTSRLSPHLHHGELRPRGTPSTA